MKRLFVIVLAFVVSSAVVSAQYAKWVLNPYKESTPAYTDMAWNENQQVYRVKTADGLIGFTNERGEDLLDGRKWRDVTDFQDNIAVVRGEQNNSLLGFIVSVDGPQKLEFVDVERYAFNIVSSDAKFTNGNLLVARTCQIDEKTRDIRKFFLDEDFIRGKKDWNVVLNPKGRMAFIDALPYSGHFATVIESDPKNPSKSYFNILVDGKRKFGSEEQVKIRDLKGKEKYVPFNSATFVSSVFRWDIQGSYSDRVLICFGDVYYIYDFATAVADPVLYNVPTKKNPNQMELVRSDKVNRGLLSDYDLKAYGAIFSLDQFGRVEKILYADSRGKQEFVMIEEKNVTAAPAIHSNLQSFRSDENRQYGITYTGPGHMNPYEVLPAQFDEVLFLKDNYAVVKVGNKCGIIEVDERQKIEIEVGNEYEKTTFYQRTKDQKLTVFLPKYFDDRNAQNIQIVSADESVCRIDKTSESTTFYKDNPSFNFIKTDVKLILNSEIKSEEGDAHVDFVLSPSFRVMYENLVTRTYSKDINSRFVFAWNLEINEKDHIRWNDKDSTITIYYSLKKINSWHGEGDVNGSLDGVEVDDIDLGWDITADEDGVLETKSKADSGESGHTQINIAPILRNKSLAGTTYTIDVPFKIMTEGCPTQIVAYKLRVEVPALPTNNKTTKRAAPTFRIDHIKY